jgi:hypothetical protein
MQRVGYGAWLSLAATIWALALSAGASADSLKNSMGLIDRESETRIPLSSLEPAIADHGIEGARQGVRDNNTTGRLTGQTFDLSPVKLKSGEEAAAAFRTLHGQGIRLFLPTLPTADLLTLADLPEAQDSLLFNLGALDDRLRVSDCRANLLHTAPSRAMRRGRLGPVLGLEALDPLVFGGGPGARGPGTGGCLPTRGKTLRLQDCRAKTLDLRGPCLPHGFRPFQRAAGSECLHSSRRLRHLESSPTSRTASASI